MRFCIKSLIKTVSLKKEYCIFFLIIFFAFIFRIFLTPLGFHDDIFSNASWGEKIYNEGSLGFYENENWVYSWPTQLPITNLFYSFNFWLYNQLNWIFLQISYAIAVYRLAPTYMIWWFDFVKWFSSQQYLDTSFKIGYLITIKLFPVVFDLLIAVVFYLIARKINVKHSVIFAIIYLFIPFSWYLSSLWGQIDQIAFLLGFVSFIFLYKRLFYLSSIAFFIAFSIKPTIGYILPLYAFYYFLQRPHVKHILLSILGVFGIFFITASPFTESSPVSYFIDEILPKVFFEDRWRITTHAFNFWAIFFPINTMSASTFILFLPAFWWGNIIVGLLYIISIVLVWQKNNFKNLIVSLYLISAGSYLFSTGMLDRYFFSAILFLGILSIYYRKLFKLWIASSLLYSFNLYYSWGFPFLTDRQAWSNPLIISVCSLTQVAVFIICIREMNVYEVAKEFVKRKIGDIPKIGVSLLK